MTSYVIQYINKIYSERFSKALKEVDDRYVEQNIIDRLLKIDFSKLDEDTIREHIDDLYEKVTEDTDLSWLPMKSGSL